MNKKKTKNYDFHVKWEDTDMMKYNNVIRIAQYIYISPFTQIHFQAFFRIQLLLSAGDHLKVQFPSDDVHDNNSTLTQEQGRNNILDVQMSQKNIPTVP